MFFFFVFGEHTFKKPVPGYEKLVCQCYNCGNMSGRVLKSNPFFTICWIVSPLRPLFRPSPALPCSSSAAPVFPTHHPIHPAKLTRTPASHPPLDKGVQGRRVPHLQLQAAAREQARRDSHGGGQRAHGARAERGAPEPGVAGGAAAAA